MKRTKTKQKDTQPIYLLSAIIFACALGIAGWLFFSSRQEVPKRAADAADTAPRQEETAACALHRVLDGVCVLTEEQRFPALVAVMIENHVNARPQSGLVDAAVVYEAPVEGNFSRFMAIYPRDAEVKKVGPVRSARPYFLDWASEYADPMYMHVGGSPDALVRLDKFNMFDVDEFYRAWFFWRSEDRYAPHNTYTSNQLWDKAWDQYGSKRKTDDYIGWTFVSNAPVCDDGCVSELTVNYLPPAYQAVWKFNSSTKQYDRFQMGKPHTDQDGRSIAADTIVVQKVKTAVLDEKLRIEMNSIGSGDAYVFTDGYMKKGTWTKASRTARTVWKDSEGNAIPLKPGKIWVEVVNQTGSISMN